MTDVVVGAGLTGLVAAELLAAHGGDVVVLDGAPGVGGLLRSYDYGDDGMFDCGTHLLSETGNADLDAILLGALPDDEWHLYEGVRRDPAGYFRDGRLHTSSPYLDLRALPDDEWARCAGDLMARWRQPIDEQSATTAAAVLDARFGTHIGRQHAGAVVEKVHRSAAANLAPSALGALPLDRVVLFDEPELAALMASATVRRRIAVPDQRRLDPRYRSTLRAMYPKAGGMQRAVDGLVDRLRRTGVEVRLGARVEGLEVEADRVSALVVDGRSVPVDRLVWTSGLPPLARALALPFPTVPTDPHLSTVLVHLRLDVEPRTHGTFYVYSWEPTHATFRVTNYVEFCPALASNGTWPVTVELLVDEPGDDDALVGRAVAEAAEMGVIDPGRITFSAVERLGMGFPRLTTANQRFIDELRATVADRNVSNLIVLGIQSEPGLFLQHEVLESVHRRLGQLQ